MQTIQQNQFNIFQQQQMIPNINHGPVNLAKMGMHSNTSAYGTMNNKISGHHQLHGHQIINQIPGQLDGQMVSQANGHRMGSHQPTNQVGYINGNSNLMPSSATLVNNNKINFSGIYGNGQVTPQPYTGTPIMHLRQQLPGTLTPQQLQQMYMMQQQKAQQIISASQYNLLHPNANNSKTLSGRKQDQQHRDITASIEIPDGAAYNDLVNPWSQQMHNINGQQKNNISSTIVNQQYQRQLQQQPTQITTAEQLLLKTPSLMHQSLIQKNFTTNGTSYISFNKNSRSNNEIMDLGMEASTGMFKNRIAVGSSTGVRGEPTLVGIIPPAQNVEVEKKMGMIVNEKARLNVDEHSNLVQHEKLSSSSLTNSSSQEFVKISVDEKPSSSSLANDNGQDVDKHSNQSKSKE